MWFCVKTDHGDTAGGRRAGVSVSPDCWPHQLQLRCPHCSARGASPRHCAERTTGLLVCPTECQVVRPWQGLFVCPSKHLCNFPHLDICLFVHHKVCLCIKMSVCPSQGLFVHLSKCLLLVKMSCLFVHHKVSLFIKMSVCLSITRSLSIKMSVVCQNICLFVHHKVYLFVYQNVCLFVHQRMTGLLFVHQRMTGLLFVHRRVTGLLFVHQRATGLLSSKGQQLGPGLNVY